MKYTQLLMSVMLAIAPVSLMAEALDADAGLAALYSDDALIGIATGTQKPIHLAPAVASVITSEQIEKMQATTLEEALELIPGLHVMPSTLKTLAPVYSIRGIQTAWNAQVLLTINGIPVKDPFSGSRISSFKLPTQNISRIEVIRGPGSAVHGADAFAGVINVITKSADELNGLNLGARIGSFDSRQSWLQYGKKIADWSLALSVEHQMSDGDSGRKLTIDSAPANISLVSRYPMQTNFNTLTARAELTNKNWNINFLSWQTRKAGLGPGIGQAIDPVGSNDTSLYMGDVSYKFSEKVAGWALSSRLSYLQTEDKNHYQILPPGMTLPIGDDGNIATAPNANCPTIPGFMKACLVNFPEGVFGDPTGHYRTTLLEFNSLNDSMENHLWRVNAGFSHYKVKASESKNFGPGTPASQIGERAADLSVPNPFTPDDATDTMSLWLLSGALTNVTGTPDVFIDDRSRRAWYLAVQDEWQFAPDWTFTGGARYDSFSDFGSTLNPRVALVWATNYNLTSKFLLGSAFRAPSFAELYQKNNPIAQGNPDLKPEKIHTAELAFDYRPNSSWQHNLNSYYYRAKDLIDYDANKVSQNLRKQSGYGFELESIWQVNPMLRLTGAYAWQRTNDKTTDAIVPDAANSKFSTSVDWQPGNNWGLYSSLNRIMDRERAVGDARADTPDYTWVNVGVRKQFGKGFTVNAALRNVFDAEAKEPSKAVDGNAYAADDYPLEGRNFFIGLEYRPEK